MVDLHLEIRWGGGGHAYIHIHVFFIWSLLESYAINSISAISK